MGGINETDAEPDPSYFHLTFVVIATILDRQFGGTRKSDAQPEFHVRGGFSNPPKLPHIRLFMCVGKGVSLEAICASHVRADKRPGAKRRYNLLLGVRRLIPWLSFSDQI